MTLSLTLVTGPVYLPNGSTPYGGRVSFELSSWDRQENEGVIVSGPIYCPIDENGQFSVSLYTSTQGENSVHYKMFVLWDDSTLAQSYVNGEYVGHPSPHYSKKYIGSFALSGPGPFSISQIDIQSELTSNSSFDVLLECKALSLVASQKVDLIYDIITDIDALGEVTEDIALLSSNIEHIQTTSQNSDKIEIVSNSIADIEIVSTNVNDVSIVANSINDVNNAFENAQIASNAAAATGAYFPDMSVVLTTSGLSAELIVTSRKENTSLRVAAPSDAVFDAWTNPSGYIVDGVSNFRINSGRNDLKASAFATFTDSDSTSVADTNTATLQRAIDWLYVNGGGAITFDGDVRVPIRAPLALRSNVHLIGRGALLENIRDTASGLPSLSANVLVMGSGALIDDDDYSWVAIKAAAVGQEYVEAVSGSTSWTAVGREIQFLRATAADFGGGTDTGNFDSHHIRRVVKIASNRVYLDRPVQEVIPSDGSGTIGSSVVVGSGWATDVSFASASGRGSGLVGCAPRHAISRASVSDFNIKARAGNWMSRMMMHDCLMENIRVLPSESTAQVGGLVGNFTSHSLVRNLRAPFWTRGLELVGHSKNSMLENIHLWKHAPVGVTLPVEETQVRVAGEKTRGMSVIDSHFDCGTLVTGVGVVTFSGGSETRFAGNTIIARGATAMVAFSAEDSDHIVESNRFIGSCSTGVNMDGVQNTVDANKMVDLTASVRAVAVGTTAVGGIVTRNRFSMGSTALVNSNTGVTDLCVIADNDGLDTIQLAGLAAVQNNRNVAVSSIRAAVTSVVSSAGVSATTTSFTDLVTPIVVPENTLRTGDIIELELSGSKTGSAGTGTVAIRVAVDTDEDGVGQDADDVTSTMIEFTVPATSGSDWIVRGKITFTSDTRLQGAFTSFTSSGVSVNEVSILSLTFGSNPLRIEVLGKVATSGDTVLRRTMDAEFKRRGY